MAEKLITFEGGIKYTPYQDASKDGEMSVLHNLEVHDGALRPAMMKGTTFRLPGRLVFVHETNEYTHYIYLEDESGDLLWKDRKDPETGGVVAPGGDIEKFRDICAIGNLIVILNKNGERYLTLWSENKYNTQEVFPQPKVRFGLEGQLTNTIYYNPTNVDRDEPNEYINVIYKGINDDKAFAFPFLVRACWWMADGTLQGWTDPVLLTPNTGNMYGLLTSDFANAAGNDAKINVLYIRTYLSMICDNMPTGTGAKLIQGIKVFVTPQTGCLKVTGRRTQPPASEAENPTFYELPKYFQGTHWDRDNVRRLHTVHFLSTLGTLKNNAQTPDWKPDKWDAGSSAWQTMFGGMTDTYATPYTNDSDEHKTNTAYIDVGWYYTHNTNPWIEPHWEVVTLAYDESKYHEMFESPTFCEFMSVKIDDLKQGLHQYEPLTTIKNIPAQDKPNAETDHEKYRTLFNKMFHYNNRVFFYGAKEEYIAEHDMKYNHVYMEDYGEYDKYEVYLRTKSEGNEHVFKIEENNIILAQSQHNALMYIYIGIRDVVGYIIRRKGSKYYYEYEMSTNSLMPGGVVYVFNGSHPVRKEWNMETSRPLRKDESNTLYGSEALNPTLITDYGKVDIGSGEILAVATMTKPLSPGQHGDYPLIAFCTDANYGLSLIKNNGLSPNTSGASSKVGLIETVTPVSPELCTNPESVVGMEDAILFANQKGILALSGNDVTNVTKDIDGPEDRVAITLKHNRDMPGIIVRRQNTRRETKDADGYEPLGQKYMIFYASKLDVLFGGFYELGKKEKKYKIHIELTQLEEKDIKKIEITHYDEYSTENILLKEINAFENDIEITTDENNIEILLYLNKEISYKQGAFVNLYGKLAEGDAGEDEDDEDIPSEDEEEDVAEKDFWEVTTNKFLRNSVPVWDYINERLFAVAKGYNKAYLIKSGCINTIDMPIFPDDKIPKYIQVIKNLWPTPYVQFDNNVVLSLDRYYDWDEVDGEGNAVVHEGYFVTRPIKMDSMALKRVREFVLKGDFHLPQVLTLFGSNDLQHWERIGTTTARRVPHVPGHYFRYWRIMVDTRLTAKECITGLLVRYDEREGRLR